MQGRAVSCAPVSSYLAFPSLPDKSGGISLLHFPWSRLRRALPAILPWELGLSSDAAFRRCTRGCLACSRVLLYGFGTALSTAIVSAKHWAAWIWENSPLKSAYQTHRKIGGAVQTDGKSPVRQGEKRADRAQPKRPIAQKHHERGHHGAVWPPGETGTVCLPGKSRAAMAETIGTVHITARLPQTDSSMVEAMLLELSIWLTLV